MEREARIEEHFTGSVEIERNENPYNIGRQPLQSRIY